MTSCSVSKDVNENEEWIRYQIVDLALLANLPPHLKPECGGTVCYFSASKDKPFESLSVYRFYKGYDHDFDFYVDSSKNYKYREIVKDATVIYVSTKKKKDKDVGYRSSAYFQTENYEFQLQYAGPSRDLFYTFLESLTIDHPLLEKQFLSNKNEPDYSDLNFQFEIDLGERDYFLNRTKNYCKVQMPESDSIRLFLTCSGCTVRKLDEDNWMMIPSPLGDSITISLKTSLPENRTYTFDEKTFFVKKE